jgi:hypothetical protein
VGVVILGVTVVREIEADLGPIGGRTGMVGEDSDQEEIRVSAGETHLHLVAILTPEKNRSVREEAGARSGAVAMLTLETDRSVLEEVVARSGAEAVALSVVADDHLRATLVLDEVGGRIRSMIPTNPSAVERTGLRLTFQQLLQQTPD